MARALKPRVLIRGVIQDELGDDSEPPAMRLLEEVLEVGERAELLKLGGVIRDVVAVVLAGGRVERQEPERRDPQGLGIVELAREPAKVTDPVSVAVEVA